MKRRRRRRRQPTVTMEITMSSSSVCSPIIFISNSRGSHLHRPPRSLTFHFPRRSPHSSSSLFSFTRRPSVPRPRRCPTPVAAPRSLSDNDASSDFAPERVEDDKSLEVKNAASDIADDLKGTSIFLVGIDNAMKTSVGKVLAESLKYYFFDSDSVVEEAGGSVSSGKSFKDQDEDGFRDAETEVLKQLSSLGRLVVSAGNGAVKNATNLGHLRHGITVWIDVPLDLIANRSSGNQPEVLSSVAAIYEEHRSGYATADARVSLQRVASELYYDELEQVSPEDMALEVFRELEKLMRVKKMKEAAGTPF